MRQLNTPRSQALAAKLRDLFFGELPRGMSLLSAARLVAWVEDHNTGTILDDESTLYPILVGAELAAVAGIADLMGETSNVKPGVRLTDWIADGDNYREKIRAALEAHVPELPADLRETWADHFDQTGRRIGLNSRTQWDGWVEHCWNIMADVDYAAGQKPRPF